MIAQGRLPLPPLNGRGMLPGALNPGATPKVRPGAEPNLASRLAPSTYLPALGARERCHWSVVRKGALPLVRRALKVLQIESVGLAGHGCAHGRGGVLGAVAVQLPDRQADPAGFELSRGAGADRVEHHQRALFRQHHPPRPGGVGRKAAEASDVVAA